MTGSAASSPTLPHAPLGEFSDSPNAESQHRAVAPWLARSGTAATQGFGHHGAILVAERAHSAVWGKERALGGLK